MKYLLIILGGLLALVPGIARSQEADSYIARLTVTPNAFVAGSRVDIRTDMKEFSSFFYRGVFWEASLDGVNFQWIGDAQQIGGDSSLTYVFRFENIPSSTFFLRAGVVTESFVVSGRTSTEYTSASQINPLRQGDPGAIGFQVNTGAISEAIGPVTVNVFRTGGISGSVGVTYSLVNGTAQAGKDFVPASGTVNFADGESTKTFTIQITEDNLAEGDETFSIVLSQPTGGAALGQMPSLLVTIQDNDAGVPAVTITVGASPANGGTVTGGGQYPAGSSVTVAATASAGFIFAGWTENGVTASTAASYTFTANASRQIVARFIPAVGPRLGIPEFQPGGGVSFDLTGSAGQTYIIEKSTNLRDWTFLQNAAPGNGAIRVTDPAPTGQQMYYRART